MKEEIELFSILLQPKEMYRLYCDIGVSTRTEADLSSYAYNRKAFRNTLSLLEQIGLIKKIEGGYQKEASLNQSEFNEKILTLISEVFTEAVYESIRKNLLYNPEDKSLSFFKNSVPLKYAGLVMLYEYNNEIESVGNKWVIIGGLLKQKLITEPSFQKHTIEELEKKLQREKELGLKAEQFVMEYEKNRLVELRIKKSPIQMSLLDTTAGYDILSYDGEEGIEERYIEVKSCSDEKFIFYISVNEIEVAKRKRKKYWLYLFNRKSETIKKICDPYGFFFEEDNQDWVKEISGYKIHSIDVE